MESKRCSFRGCPDPRYCRGWCIRHYNRWRKNGDPSVRSAAPSRRRPLADRFWEKVDRSEGPAACWPFTDACSAEGYGSFGVPDPWRKVGAHCVAYMLHHGLERLPTQWVLHSCDNPPCCNPRHLRLGTPTDNVRDAVGRGRHRYGFLDHSLYRGEGNGHARLTWAKVREIRRLWGEGVPKKRIAHDFGVNPRTIDFIVKGETWKVPADYGA